MSVPHGEPDVRPRVRRSPRPDGKILPFQVDMSLVCRTLVRSEQIQDLMALAACSYRISCVASSLLLLPSAAKTDKMRGSSTALGRSPSQPPPSPQCRRPCVSRSINCLRPSLLRPFGRLLPDPHRRRFPCPPTPARRAVPSRPPNVAPGAVNVGHPRAPRLALCASYERAGLGRRARGSVLPRGRTDGRTRQSPGRQVKEPQHALVAALVRTTRSTLAQGWPSRRRHPVIVHAVQPRSRDSSNYARCNPPALTR